MADTSRKKEEGHTQETQKKGSKRGKEASKMEQILPCFLGQGQIKRMLESRYENRGKWIEKYMERVVQDVKERFEGEEKRVDITPGNEREADKGNNNIHVN